MRQDKFFEAVNKNFDYAAETLNLAKKEEAIEEAVTKMKKLKFSDDVIESFKKDGNLEFRMENDQCIPLNEADRKTILLLNAAGYLVCGVFRTIDGYCSYIVSSKYKMHWEKEKMLMKDNLFLVYSNKEFKLTKIEILPNGMMNQIWPEPKNNPCPDNDVKDDETVSKKTIEEMRIEIDDMYSFYRNDINLTENSVLAFLFSDAYLYHESDAFVNDSYQSVNVYRLTNGIDDYISLLEDIYLVAKGSIKEIIARSGLTKYEFCNKLGIQCYMLDMWDNKAEKCPVYYRFLMGRYLGIIREPIFMRDAYTCAAEVALSNM